MDLQLGLALSSNSVKGFDLNCSGMMESKEDVDSVKFGIQQCIAMEKRSFDEAFCGENDGMLQTLPLLVWEGQGDSQDDLGNTSVLFINKVDRDGEGMVGWPPINPSRKRICNQNHRGSSINFVTVQNCGRTEPAPGGNRDNKNNLYVKVKMEGVGIGRKVDLSRHHSHETLLQTLVAMFGKCRDTAHAYQLTYQDKEGDWQPAEDASWGAFVGSVQRLKLQRRRE